ncbi:hypothetical protein CDV36_005043 [Fusarium kuroshium]|uniref:Uncharacterized protein n=1 Tax=Fusarium kuroshium TaxID=2010991 RepID=A0A3M2SCK8_9HYPO|nr:hypothetical protein CDV36_005043 [Fusarium kuroshium]
MNTQESSGQEPTCNPSEASARSKPIPKGEPTAPTTTSTSSSSRPRRQWSRLESAKNRLKASESLNAQSSSSQPQPQDDGPSSRVDSLSKDLDASTLNETIDDETTENGTADALPTNETPTDKQPASETAAHDSPASGYNEDKSKPDARNPPPESSKQDPGAAAPPLFSVDKAAEDAMKLLGLDAETLLWTLVYRVICLEHRQGFLPEEYDKLQYVSVNVGHHMRNIRWDIARRQQAASTEHPDTATTQMPTETKLERTVAAMAQASTVMKPEMIKTTVARLPGEIDRAIKEIDELRAESPETVEAKSAWIQKLEELSMGHLRPLQDQVAAILRAKNVSLKDRAAIAKSVLAMDIAISAVIRERETLQTAIAEATAAELPNIPQAIPAQTPKETQEEMLAQAARRVQMFKAFRDTVAQIPEIAEDTELPLALKRTAETLVETMSTARTYLTAMPARMEEAAQICEEFEIAAAVITARLKLTNVTEEEPAAGKHAGPTYPWGIFEKLEKAAKTTVDYEISMARQGFKDRVANPRDATEAQLRPKRIQYLLVSIAAQCSNLSVDLAL